VPTAQQVVGISAVDGPWRYLEDLPIPGISTRHCKGCPLYTEVSRLALPLGDRLTGPAASRRDTGPSDADLANRRAFATPRE
jgi:hypothetical protein